MVEQGLRDSAGKVSVVTVARSGIGRVFYEATAEHVSDVVCADINEEWAW